MKRQGRLLPLLLTLAVLGGLVLLGCPNPTSNDTNDDGGGTGTADNSKINFENWDGAWAYNPGNAMTEVDTQSTAEKDSNLFKNGSASLKISGTTQKDKYSDAQEIGMRIKAAEILSVTNLDVINKVISLWVYVPEGANNNAIQVNLQDNSYQQAMGNALAVTPGEWTQVFYKLLPAGDANNTKYADRPCFVSVSDAAGSTVTQQGAYTSDTFNVDTITVIEIRSLNGTNGETATVNIDSIDWN